MKKMLLFLLIIMSVLSYSQTEALDTIKYSFFIEQEGMILEAFKGEIIEGGHFTIDPMTLTGTFAINQEFYDALVGSELGLEIGSLDRNIQMNITLGGLNSAGQLFVEGQPLFMFLQVDILDLKTGDWYEVDSSFYFLNGKGAYMNIPVTEALLSFCAKNGINLSDGLSFSYLVPNGDGTYRWTAIGLSWNVNYNTTPWLINLKLTHFSRFGGGGKTLATDVKPNELLPDQFVLLQNYPNPFNPSTTIAYNLPEEGYLTLKIYNTLGKEVAVLESGQKSAGLHTSYFDAGNLSSGTYFYTINYNGEIQSRKMLLIK